MAFLSSSKTRPRPRDRHDLRFDRPRRLYPEGRRHLIAKLKEAGAIVLAKSTMPDFATSWFGFSSKSGETKNPYVLDRDPGGSSSGTGAAVAANLATVGIGEDTGGSIREPASFNNLVGVRVTPGLISRDRHVATGRLPGHRRSDDAYGDRCRDPARCDGGIRSKGPVHGGVCDRRAHRKLYRHLDRDGLKGARIGFLRRFSGATAIRKPRRSTPWSGPPSSGWKRQGPSSSRSRCLI